MTTHTNIQPKRADEPIFWGLFGAGGMVVALMLPAIVVLTAFILPSSQSIGYEQYLSFAQSWIGKLWIWLLISLPMWHVMHRIYHGMHDIKIETTTIHKFACYGLALIVSIVSAGLLFAI